MHRPPLSSTSILSLNALTAVCTRGASPGGAQRRLQPLALLLLLGLPSLALAQAGEAVLPVVSVQAETGGSGSSEESGLYTAGASRSASRLELPLQQTPQTVSVVSRRQLDDFGLNSVNEALEASTVINVEQVETDRTYYTARGFDVTQFQLDGVGLPFSYDLVHGDMDTALYDRIEVVYGATGLMTGTGMPSAAVNFVRKRTQAKTHAEAEVTVGSWDHYRLQADAGTALTASGAVRGRVVAVADQTHSWIDRYSRDKSMLYGIVEADVRPGTQLALGHVTQRNQADGALWGALPLLNSDGSPTHYARSTSTAADWAYWDSSSSNSFAELMQQLQGDWRMQLVLSHQRLKNQGDLFYVYGSPDAVTGEGLFAWPSAYTSSARQNMADLSLSGSYEMAGRRHQLSTGISWGRAELQDQSYYGLGIGDAVPPLAGWDGQFARPDFNLSQDGSDFSDRRHSVYVANRLQLAQALHLIAGARWTDMQLSGMSYQVPRTTSASDVTPYVGVVYDLTPQLAVYASHARVFDPQHESDVNGQVLAPVRGRSHEVGFKAAFNDDQLNVSMAWFDVQQDNLAQEAGWDGVRTYYAGVDTRSRGVQVDVSGQLTRHLQLNAGAVGMTIEDDQGNAVRTYIPRHQLRLNARYRLPLLPALTIGGGLSWQDDTWADAGVGELRQQAYALFNAMASYEFSPRLSAQLNINNLTDRTYVNSLYWGYLGQGFYGAPRQVEASLKMSF